MMIRFTNEELRSVFNLWLKDKVFRLHLQEYRCTSVKMEGDTASVEFLNPGGRSLRKMPKKSSMVMPKRGPGGRFLKMNMQDENASPARETSETKGHS